LIDPVLDWCGK